MRLSLVAAVAILCAGCTEAVFGGGDSNDASPNAVLLGVCRTFSPETDFGPMSTHFLNVTIENAAGSPYAFEQEDWEFFDANGTQAMVSSWGNPEAPDHDHLTLRPGESSTWFFVLFKPGTEPGNLTHVRFKEGPLVRLASAAPLLPAEEGPCWGDFDWRVMYTSPPWGEAS